MLSGLRRFQFFPFYFFFTTVFAANVFITNAFAVGIPQADIEASQFRAQTQYGALPVVIEGSLEQATLKDLPLSFPVPWESRTFTAEEGALVYLRDVENLTGILPNGFDLPFSVGTPEAER